MFKVTNVKIEGFWGEQTVESEFNQDTNIFVGRNGTGKTTFINLLQAVLAVDFEMLYSLQFDKIILQLKDKSKSRKIEVSKDYKHLEYRTLTYKIGRNKYELPYIGLRDISYINKRQGRIHPKFLNNTIAIRSHLDKLVNISYLSVHRENLLKDVDEFSISRDSITNNIDSKLDELEGDLTSFQLELETEVSKKSKSFQENVLRSMLFNADFDYVDINQRIKLDLKSIRVGLKQAYRGLGILDSKTTDIIDNHVQAIAKAAEKINAYVDNNEKDIYPNDVTPLTLIRRTEKILALSVILENEKKDLFEPISNFLRLLNEFHAGKTFALDNSKHEGFVITKNGTPIKKEQLSSGEKQLIILLTETLLQRNNETIYIADEPELSLHIEWQRKIIPSIQTLNPNAQIIVATHSPEIVGKLKSKTVNMENIVYG